MSEDMPQISFVYNQYLTEPQSKPGFFDNMTLV